MLILRNFISEIEGRRKLGGCATVAGWGNRYSVDDQMYTHDDTSACMTDASDASMDKIT